MFIYLIVNHVTGKYYVGQHKGSNLKQYLQKKFYEADRRMGGRSYLYASMRKYGRGAFTIHALLSDVQTRPELDAYERDFISFLKSQDPEYGYNICRGGEGRTDKGWHHSAATIEKISKSNQGKHRDSLTSPEMQAARLAAWQRVLDEKNGSFQTTESIDKIKVARAKQDESVRLVAFRKAEEAHGEEWTKRRVTTRRRAGSFGKMSESGRKSQISAVVAANHLRWHVNRGTINPTCVLCIRG